MPPKHKKLLRINHEEGLRVRRRGGCKLASDTRAPMILHMVRTSAGCSTLSLTAWSAVSVSVSCAWSMTSRAGCLSLVVFASLSCAGVGKIPTTLINLRGKPHPLGRDNGTEPPRLPSCDGQKFARSSCITTHKASTCRMATPRASMATWAMNCSSGPFDLAWITLTSRSQRGRRITATNGHSQPLDTSRQRPSPLNCNKQWPVRLRPMGLAAQAIAYTALMRKMKIRL